MEKSIQKVSTIDIGFGNWQIADFFHDKTICIADCEKLTIGHSLLKNVILSVWLVEVVS